jgi:hypothetical protein
MSGGRVPMEKKSASYPQNDPFTALKVESATVLHTDFKGSADKVPSSGTNTLNGSQAKIKTATNVKLTIASDKAPHVQPVKFVNRSGRYEVADFYRPKLEHDAGFVGAFGRRAPTSDDYISKAKWLSYLNGAEVLCRSESAKSIGKCSNEDLTDALAAYRHYWYGKGKDRHINYEAYLESDPSAKNLINDLVNDFITHIEIIGENRANFHVVSQQYAIAGHQFAPYPTTVNWKRTIGAHKLWINADVKALVKNQKIEYEAELIIHMEDRYNFNPTEKDTEGKYKDEENGAFEMIGWAHPYMHYSSVARHVKWIKNQGKLRTISARPAPPPDVIKGPLWDLIK